MSAARTTAPAMQAAYTRHTRPFVRVRSLICSTITRLVLMLIGGWILAWRGRLGGHLHAVILWHVHAFVHLHAAVHLHHLMHHAHHFMHVVLAAAVLAAHARRVLRGVMLGRTSGHRLCTSRACGKQESAARQ